MVPRLRAVRVSGIRWSCAIIHMTLLFWIPVAAYEWHIETADSVGGVVQYASLALDGFGYPHVSYFDDTSDDLKYAYLDEFGWHIETVVATGDVGPLSSLALDGSARPHISYFDNTNDDLKYAHKHASGWHVETPDSDGDVGRHSSVALDAGRWPHISYQDATNWDLKHAYLDSSGWHTEAVADGGYCTSLALDGEGSPSIGYLAAGPSAWAVWCTNEDTSGWHTECIFEGNKNGFYYGTSLALDMNGHPHITSVPDSWGPRVLYAHNDGTGWHTDWVGPGDCACLALDESGCAHISCYGPSYTWPSEGLQYACQQAPGDSVWHTETVDSGTWIGYAGYTSLALDGLGHPHIAYYEPTNGDLKYAFVPGTVHAEDPHRAFPVTARLLSVWPNPATTGAAVFYSLSRSLDSDRRVSLQVLDPLGRLVATPTVSAWRAGTHSAWWDLSSFHGGRAAPGVYYLRLEAGDSGSSAVGRLVVIR